MCGRVFLLLKEEGCEESKKNTNSNGHTHELDEKDE